MKRLLAVLLFAGVAHAAPSAHDVERAVGGYERSPTAADVARLGPGADQALIAYADAPSTARALRRKAILALGLAPSPAARDWLLALVARTTPATRGADVLDAVAAISALAPYGAAHVSALMPHLQHAVADVREAVATVFMQWRAVDTAPALRLRLVAERDPGVRRALMRALDVVGNVR